MDYLKIKHNTLRKVAIWIIFIFISFTIYNKNVEGIFESMNEILREKGLVFGGILNLGIILSFLFLSYIISLGLVNLFLWTSERNKKYYQELEKIRLIIPISKRLYKMISDNTKSKKFKFKYDDGKLSRIDETKFNNHISKKVYDIIKKEYKNNRGNKK